MFEQHTLPKNTTVKYLAVVLTRCELSAITAVEMIAAMPT